MCVYFNILTCFFNLKMYAKLTKYNGYGTFTIIIVYPTSKEEKNA